MTDRADAVGDAVAVALAGRLIVIPTDTVYGIGTRPDDPAAVARLFAAKGRPRDLALPILAATTAAAREVARFDDRADRLAFACWPGALTIVLPRTALSAGWDLGGEPDTVAVRVPHHPLALAVLAGTGPLAVTSANASGRPPARDCAELRAAFADAVDLYLCGDELLEGSASTLVDLAHGDARILRVGAVAPDRVARFLPGEGPLLDSRPSP